MGWNGSGRASGAAATAPSHAAKKTPSKHYGFIVFVVVVLGAVLALLFVLKDQDETRHEERTRATSTRTTAPARPATVKSSSVVAVKRTNRIDVSAAPSEVAPIRSSGETPSSAPDETSLTNADTEASKDHLAHKPTFKNGVEQLLDMVTPSSPGVRIPPLPIITDEGLKDELKRALKNIPKATENDTEDTIRRKLAVEDRKDEFVEVNKETGMSITEYVQAVRDQHNDNADFMAEAHTLDEEIKNDATVSDADYKNTHDQINTALEKRGLPKIESEIDELPAAGKEPSK